MRKDLSQLAARPDKGRTTGAKPVISVTHRRVLFVQFTDPAAYPPIEHASHLLAGRGWHVVLLGTGTLGNLGLQLSNHPHIRLKKLKFVRGGWKQKLLYCFFFVVALYWTWRWKPEWVYASDPLVTPVVSLIKKLLKVRIAYHEHDSPNPNQARTWFMRHVFMYRNKLGRNAELCILPQKARLCQFVETTGRTRPAFCVWNCPRIDEISDCSSRENGRLILHYHGSITSSRLPTELIVAASRFRGIVRLQLAGYEAPGSIGYIRELIAIAVKNGAAELIEPLGTIPRRSDLLRSASKAHVGLSFMPKRSDDINLQHMVGASNKAFDYMACGLPLLVTDLPEWVSTFVEPGYARACDPDDADSMESAVRWYLDHQEERREMGRRCQDKIRQSWNYEKMFADVLDRMGNA
jgi:glycosyltransferase involved in cell wall biosynthesis